VKKAIFIAVVMFLILCATPVYAQVPLPNAFWGSVEINGSNAPAGTHVKATGNGVEVPVDFNPIITEEDGQYGGAAWNDPKLLVQCETEPGPDTVIEFYVSRDGVTWVKAETEPAPVYWGSGEITRVDLTATIPTGGGGGGGGGAPPTPPGTIGTNLFGNVSGFSISSTGEVLQTITAGSADGTLSLVIPAGTIALDAHGNPLSSLTADIDPNPPCPPPEGAYIIGLTYSFEPDGATFAPPISLEYTYDPAEIPEGVAEEDLVIAYCDEDSGEWVECPCTVDPVTHTITASVSHFTTFAIITPPVPPPPPAAAAFSVSGLSIQPTEVEPDEVVTVTVSVANTGGTEGSYSVVLKINGVTEAEKSVTVAADSSQSVSFTVTREEAASYSVVVDGQSGSFVVVAPAPPPPPPPSPTAINWLVLGPIIAVIVVGLLIFFLVRRRAY